VNSLARLYVFTFCGTGLFDEYLRSRTGGDKMRRKMLLVAALTALAVCAVAFAQQSSRLDVTRIGAVSVSRAAPSVVRGEMPLYIPWHINYQGYLTDDLGNPLTGDYYMAFAIFDSANGGSELWQEEKTVSVEDGLFNVVLGTLTPIGPNLFLSGDPRFLQLNVEAQNLLPRTEITSVGFAYKAVWADSADYAFGGGSSNWSVTGVVLHPSDDYGLSMRGTNVLYGSEAATHVNLGVSCTTGTPGFNYITCTISGGAFNVAAGSEATVGGGSGNVSRVLGATIAGGGQNTAGGSWSFIGGGWTNTANGDNATLVGGSHSTANHSYATVCGGYNNDADSIRAFVGGGADNVAAGDYSVVCGGHYNRASGSYSTVAGGLGAVATGHYSASAGNYADTCHALDGFVACSWSNVPAGYSNSAAFNGQTATTAGQTRVATLSKTGGGFTIDHPTDPAGKILNHYFVESPEMVLIYRGTAAIGPSGRAEVHLPVYFDELSQNPMVQLTGVGTSDVFVAEKVRGNRFVIGGKPGTEVYWTVTGDRRDQSAEIIRTVMPVEQQKEGGLAGRSLDDEFLAATANQLEQMGVASKFSPRTQAGRKRYEMATRQKR
jgi:hypothetical protein